MSKFVYVIGTADTKLDEMAWVKSCMHAAGVDAYIIDVSTSSPACSQGSEQIDINAGQIADYHPAGREHVFCNDRGKAISAMSEALLRFLVATVDDISGVLGLGGSGGTALITPGMQALPTGIPKIMLSTMASGNVAPYVGASDIAMMYTVTDLSGLNRVSRMVLTNAANMMAGAVNHAATFQNQDRPSLGLTMFGVTTSCINQLTSVLNADYDTLVFHATGNGGMSMEKLIKDGELAGVLDITLTEIDDLLFGGVLACPESRLDSVAESQIPWIGSAGALDMVNFGARASVPERYQDRHFVEHNAQVTLMRTTPEENRKLGVWIGNKLNRCNGPVCFIVPEGGFSALDCPGQPFWLPQATEAFIDGLESTVNVTDNRRIIRTPAHINSPEFCALVIKIFSEMMQHQGNTK
ncbi:Tm-1-like ATP-binding domain-containing protein [Enterobacillus tribolii]|uniref:Uncharacterized protein (UPF0261 family) n=1 Tax=Enterobacillus tribolii TaxID=1487935 RepID=A0A370R1N7_9GAMM|nr:Tm-1-like ATP-binding domain-containing protein [Enterobacillus tribolii]MBW7983069.1 UPF0261 family protein [Enterobacillus tribolii]RDK95827.1 uncharacterized protein (UPF0261 family) [Enterobacillus tribolii]